MVKAQEYLDKNYPTKESRAEIRTCLGLSNQGLEKHLDVSDFINLQCLHCDNNQITSLDIGENNGFYKMFLENNKITANLEIFSHLTKLQYVHLGTADCNGQRENKKTNDFIGSLKCFENCKDLMDLNIDYNEKITEGLEFLSNGLSNFSCRGTIFYDMLKPYNFDIISWKLVNHPSRVVNDPKLLVEKIDEKIREVRANLSIYENHHSGENEKIAGLKSQLEILSNHKEKAISANKSLESFEEFSHKMVENIVEENKNLKNKVEVLEKQLEQLKLETKIEIQPK